MKHSDILSQVEKAILSDVAIVTVTRVDKMKITETGTDVIPGKVTSPVVNMELLMLYCWFHCILNKFLDRYCFVTVAMFYHFIASYGYIVQTHPKASFYAIKRINFPF